MTKRCANKGQKPGLQIKGVSFPGVPQGASRQDAHWQVHWWVKVPAGKGGPPHFLLVFKAAVSILTSRCSMSPRVAAAATAAKLLQLCPTLCNPIDGSPPGSPVPGILQARTLEWVAISCSNAWQWKVKVRSLSRVQLLATPWTAAYQAPPSMGFSR